MKPTRSALILFLAATGAIAQNPGATATIRLVVSDKSGPVRNLSAKDFKVSVDGKDRPVTAAAIAPASPRAVVLLFDNTTINVQDQANLRGWVTNFLTQAANPNLYVEVATFRAGVQVIQPFTTDAARLKAALVGTASSAVAGPEGITGLEGSFATISGGRGGRTMATTLGPAAASGARTQEFAESLRGLLDSLATIRGPKALLLFSGGQTFSADAAPQVDAAIEAANRDGVTIYGISDNTSFTRTFADPTGGSTIKVTQYMAAALQQIVQELNSFYDVAINLADAGPGGGCHALKVKVDAPGTDVRAPKSFCASAQRDSLAGTAGGKSLDAMLAGKTAGSLAASAQAFWRYEGGEPQARAIVALDAPASGIAFQKVKNKFHGELNVAAAAYRQDGAVADRFSETVAFDFNDKNEADALAKRPYHYENTLQLAAGKYTVKAAISTAADTWGKAETPLEIAGRNLAGLDMSGVALAREVRPAATNASDLDPGMLESSTSLMAGGNQVLPAGQLRFKKSEKVYLYTEIYEPSLARATPEAVGFQYRIVDRASGDVKAASGGLASVANFVRPGNLVIPVATAVATSQLGPGAYRLEVRAANASGSEDVVRSVDFDLSQ